MPSLRVIAGILLAGAMALAIGVSGSLAGASERRVEIDIRYSLFAPTEVRVPVGVPIRFVIVNHDPIDHEWIVGDAAVHAAHRTGTEPVHGARPTEQSIEAAKKIKFIPAVKDGKFVPMSIQLEYNFDLY